MPSANVDVVRSWYEAWERGDLAGVAEWADPEFQYVIADGPDPGTWTGLAESIEGFRDLVSVWEDFRFEAEEFRELDNERVLVLLRRSGRGKGSGLELGQMRSQGASVLQLRDGKVTRLVNYIDRQNALADLGLAAETETASPPD